MEVLTKAEMAARLDFGDTLHRSLDTGVLTEAEMAARLDFRRPIQEAAEPEREPMWCIPFEWGPNAKGTMITISKAREISSELRALVAEAEKRELRREFLREQARSKSAGESYTAAEQRCFELRQEVSILKQQLRRARRRKRG